MPVVSCFVGDAFREWFDVMLYLWPPHKGGGGGGMEYMRKARLIILITSESADDRSNRVLRAFKQKVIIFVPSGWMPDGTTPDRICIQAAWMSGLRFLMLVAWKAAADFTEQQKKKKKNPRGNGKCQEHGEGWSKNNKPLFSKDTNSSIWNLDKQPGEWRSTAMMNEH